MSRIYFFSNRDRSSPHNLALAETVLDNFNETIEYDLNGLLEFYHIKYYLDNDIYLACWTEEKKAYYKRVTEITLGQLKSRIILLISDQFGHELSKIDPGYRKAFWELINNLKLYKKIEKDHFSKFIDDNPNQIRYVLLFKNIVNHFDLILGNFLKKYPGTTELILDKFEKRQDDQDRPDYSFPTSLSFDDKEDIFAAYLDGDHVNLNYVRLLENSKKTQELNITDKLRLKAYRKSKELNDKLLEDAKPFKLGVSLKMDQVEPVKFIKEQNELIYSYSEAFFDKIVGDDVLLFLSFNWIFHFTDQTNLISLVYKESESDALEKTLMGSKNEYVESFAFQRKNSYALLQLNLMTVYLEKHNKSIEGVLESFIHHLSEKYFIENLSFNLPSPNLRFVEKCRFLAPEIESLLKQYKLYVENGYIDKDLLQISSTPIQFSTLKSKVSRKYLYEQAGDLSKIKILFFSDQSPLHYILKFDRSYNNFFEIITHESLKFEACHDFQQTIIKDLINDGYLELDKEGAVCIVDMLLLLLLKHIHEDSVISYWHFSDDAQKKLDELESAGWLSAQNTLFTKAETNYLNYYLNKKEFTNGHDLRNKYMHGTNSIKEAVNELDYQYFLMISILILLKIDDDLSIMP